MNIPKTYLKNKFVRLFKAYIMKDSERMELNVDGDDFAFTAEDAAKLYLQAKLPSIFKSVGETSDNELDVTDIIFPKDSAHQMSVLVAVIKAEQFDDTIQLNPDEYSVHYPLKTVTYGFSIKEYEISSVKIIVDLQSQQITDINIKWDVIDPKTI